MSWAEGNDPEGRQHQCPNINLRHQPEPVLTFISPLQCLLHDFVHMHLALWVYVLHLHSFPFPPVPHSVNRSITSAGYLGEQTRNINRVRSACSIHVSLGKESQMQVEGPKGD